MSDLCYKMFLPPLKHQGLRYAKWMSNKKDIIVSASDGVWLYEDPINLSFKKKLIIYKKDRKYKDSEIFEVIPVNVNSEWVVYRTRYSELTTLNIFTGEVCQLGHSSFLFSLEIEFTKNGEFMIVGETGERLKIWDYNKRKLLEDTSDICGPISSVYQGNKILCSASNMIDEFVEYDFLINKKKQLVSSQKILEISGKEFIDCEWIIRTDEKVITYHYKEAIRIWNSDMTIIFSEWTPNFSDDDDYKFAFDGIDAILALSKTICMTYNIQSTEIKKLLLQPHHYGEIFSFSNEMIILFSVSNNEIYFYNKL